MFTGIIETFGTVNNVVEEGTNIHYTIESSLSNELKIDQSVAHNGVCLTVVGLTDHTHTVTAIQETLEKTNLKFRDRFMKMEQTAMARNKNLADMSLDEMDSIWNEVKEEMRK